MSEQRHLVLVIGMHRSGTSLMTAGLAAIGCRLGDFVDTHHPENPKGFFEHPAVRQFNDRLLAARGAAWDNWGYDARADGVATLTAARDEAATLLRHLFPGPGPHLLKDPRIATLLPFWEAVLHELGWRVSRILIVRDPSEVAASLRKRAERSPAMAGVTGDTGAASALWAVTMHTMLTSLPEDGASSLLINHAALYDRPAAVLRAAADFAGLTFDEQAVAQFLTDFLDPSLRHYVPSPAPAELGWPTVAAGLFAALCPAETPRAMTGGEASAILAGQPELRTLMLSLGATRHSIAHSRQVAAEQAARLQIFRRAIWRLRPAAIHGAGPERIGPLLADVAALRTAAPDELSLLALHAQLLEKSVDLTAAESLWRSAAALAPAADWPLRSLATLLHRLDRHAEAAELEADLARRFPAKPLG
jgi:hypothetical protein